MKWPVIGNSCSVFADFIIQTDLQWLVGWLVALQHLLCPIVASSPKQFPNRPPNVNPLRFEPPRLFTQLSACAYERTCVVVTQLLSESICSYMYVMLW